jgi:hypothetical protein
VNNPDDPFSGKTNAEMATEQLRTGLCASCRHVERITSTRGTTFYLCRRALTDASFRKYPVLPVRSCVGHEPLAD